MLAWENLEARAGIEPAHKGFAVLTATRNPLIKQGISVGFWLPKGVVLAPLGTLLATLMATMNHPSRLLQAASSSFIKSVGSSSRDEHPGPRMQA